MHSDPEDTDTSTEAADDDGGAGAPAIDPVLKRFIDAVIVPAFLDRLRGTLRFGGSNDESTRRPETGDTDELKISP